MIHSPFSKKAV